MNFKYLVFAILGLFILSCDKDEDPPTPKPVESDPPVAAFTVTTENLIASFSNTSTNANTYAWDFGDGNSSTDKDPTHTYAASGSYMVKLTATGDGGSNETSQSVEVFEPYKKTGHILTSVVSNSGGFSYYGGYFEELPSGDIDLTQAQTFQRIRFNTVHNGFIYGGPTNNEPGIAKLAVDAQTNQIVTVAEIPLFDFPGDITIVSDELGFYAFFGLKEIGIFNPTTMEVLGNVDMTGAREFPEGDDIRNGYNSIVYNEKTNKIYATSYTNNASIPAFYTANEVWVEVIDVDTKTREKTIIHPDAQYALQRGATSAIVDEEGNTYLLCQGSYGLDQQIGPTAAKGSRPQFIKINTNSEFDTSYAYNPINDLGFQNNFFQLITSAVYAGNNKAYALGTSQADSPEIIALLGKLGQGTITAAEYDQLVALVLYDESMTIIEIDLLGKTASTVGSAPQTAGFGYPFMYNYGDKMFSQITKDGGMFNGFYVVDKNTNAIESAFNIVAGGLATYYVDLSYGF